MTTRQSRRLNKSSSNSVDLFIVDNEDPPSLNGESFDKHESWGTVWIKLKKTGWKWKNAGGLSSYAYLKPGIKSTKNAREGVDYFINENHLRDYVKKKYNWCGPSINNLGADVEDDTSTEEDNESLPSKNINNNISCLQNSKRKQNQKVTENNLKEGDLIKKRKTTNKQNIAELNLKVDMNIVKKENDVTRISKSSLGDKKISKAIPTKRDVEIVVGSKKKPGFISFKDKGDYRVGRRIAFLMSSSEGEVIANYYENNLPSEALTTIEKNGVKKQYIVGVVDALSSDKKRKDYYVVKWEYSSPLLSPIQFQPHIIDLGLNQFNHLKSNIYSQDENKEQEEYPFSKKFISKLREFNPQNIDGDVIESDDCFSDSDLFDDEDLYLNYNVNTEANFSQIYNEIRKSNQITKEIPMYQFVPHGDEKKKYESINGLKWEMNTKLDPPAGLGNRPKTSIKHEYRYHFPTELDSLLAFLPVKFWVYHLNECNRYVEQCLKNKDSKNKVFNGMIWKPININELMVFYAILIQMACRPYPGKRYEECWEFQKEWFSNCQKMNKTRFKQIRASLHWCNNPHSKSSQDTLYKIRPMINILSGTIGKHLIVGESLALDETTVGLYHTYAKALIFYNPKKPRGKHHCKLYTVCENDSWAAINFQFCHRSYADKKETQTTPEPNPPIPSKTISKKKTVKRKKVKLTKKAGKITKKKKPKESVDEDSIDEDNHVMSDCDDCEEIPKMVQIVSSLCKQFEGTGVVMNMDNLYSSPEVFIQLLQMGIFARGTFRSNRKFLPSFIQFTKQDTKKIPRGSFRLATNKKYNLSCYAWNDKNPVHVLSSADGTDINMTQRRSKSETISVLCPSAIKRYNHGMQGVDQFNKLLTLFSLANLKFDKYYKKLRWSYLILRSLMRFFIFASQIKRSLIRNILE